MEAGLAEPRKKPPSKTSNGPAKPAAKPAGAKGSSKPHVGRRRGEHESTVHRDLLNKPGVSNWVEDTGHLPSYIKRVAKHIQSDSGYSESRAIAAAVSQTKKRAATNPQAAAAVAKWEAQKAASGGGKGKSSGGKGKSKPSSGKTNKSGGKSAGRGKKG